jgi:hypothetical protein
VAFFKRYVALTTRARKHPSRVFPAFGCTWLIRRIRFTRWNLRQVLGSFGRAEVLLNGFAKNWGKMSRNVPDLAAGEPAKRGRESSPIDRTPNLAGRSDGAASSNDFGLKFYPSEVELINSFLRHV